jgi:hypothetical protein
LAVRAKKGDRRLRKNAATASGTGERVLKREESIRDWSTIVERSRRNATEMMNRLITVLFLAITAQPALSQPDLPFEASPEGFVEYLNSGKVSWPDNSINTFYNPRGCFYSESEVTVGHGRYRCDMDFETQTLIGKRRCINYTIEYWTRRNAVDREAYSTSSQCGNWEKVEEAPPEPQPETPPRTAPSTPTALPDVTQNNSILIAAGTGLFLAGGLAGGAITSLMTLKRKRSASLRDTNDLKTEKNTQTADIDQQNQDNISFPYL